MKLRKPISSSILLLSTSLLFACGSDDALEINDQPLQGTINGKSFSVEHGYAKYNQERDEFRVRLFPVSSEDPCGDPADYSDEKIIFFREAKVGGGELGLSENITFVYDKFDGDESFPQNDIATEGYWEFTEITDDKVVGGLVAQFRDHSVNGTFELTNCPDPFAN